MSEENESVAEIDFEQQKKDRYKTYSNSENNSFKLGVIPREAKYRLNKDVILPASSEIQIQEALAKIRYHKKIYEEWGFNEVDPKGKGVILNFYGKSGTGKTLTAEALAGTLGIPFLPVGIAELESKFMGETAKNIQAIFEVAAEYNALLFFDEADTLLGKRLSSVTQGVDNEVNASRSTMLIEIEKFEGVLIFASNFAENYDKAFESRISHHIHFQLPDDHGRRKIWEKHLIAKIPLEGDYSVIVETVVEKSKGLSGRDIRTCMRIALPKPLLESESSGLEPRLKLKHLEEAIIQVKDAHTNVGQEVNPMSAIEHNSVRKMLGISDKTKQNEGV